MSTAYWWPSKFATSTSRACQCSTCSGGGVGARGCSSGGGVMGCRGGSCSRCSSRYASLSVWLHSGGSSSSVTFKGPKSWRGSTGSCHWGRGSMLGSDSTEESRSMTGGLGGGSTSASSSDVSDDTSITGSWSTSGGGTGLRGRRGCGNSKNSRMSCRMANLTLYRLPLSSLLLSLLLSDRLTGLMHRMARSASIEAVR